MSVKSLRKENQIDQDIPFGFLDDGINDITGSFTDKDGIGGI